MVHLTNLTNHLLLGEDSPAQHGRSVEEFGQEAEGTGMHGYDTVGNENADTADGPWKGCFSRTDILGWSAKCKAGDRHKGKGSCVAETYSIPDHDDELCRSDGQNGRRSRRMMETCVACVVGERLDCDRHPSALPTAGCGRTSYSSDVLDFVEDEWICQEGEAICKMLDTSEANNFQGESPFQQSNPESGLLIFGHSQKLFRLCCLL